MFMFRINSCINKRCMLESELAYKNRQILSKSQMLRGQKVGKGLQEKDLTHERSVQSCRQLLSSCENKSLKKGLNKICIRFKLAWMGFEPLSSLTFSRLSFMLNFQPLFEKWAHTLPPPPKRAGCMGLLLLIISNQTTACPHQAVSIYYFSWSRF